MIGWFALGGTEKSVEKSLGGFGSAVTSGPAGTVFKYWFLAGGAMIVVGGALWYAENEVAKRRGEVLALPGTPSLGLPPPPSFSGSGGFGANLGPVSVSQGIGAGGAPAPVIVNEPRSAETYPRFAGRGDRPSRTARKAARINERAALADARRNLVESRGQLAQARKGGFGKRAA